MPDAADDVFSRRTVLLTLLAVTLGGCTTATLETVAPTRIVSTNYAAMVVDAGNGRTLFQAKADAARYPASLTKMMTLYLLFEALESGRVARATEIPVSDNARRQPPTKIGFKAGQSIDVDSAIKALVTKSANDVAVAVVR